jgi:Fic family protein
MCMNNEISGSMILFTVHCSLFTIRPKPQTLNPKPPTPNAKPHQIRFTFEAYCHKMRFMWIWQAKQWPNFSVDALALQGAITAARVAQGRLLGLASQLQLVALSDIHIDSTTAEAVATAQIEGEILHPQSVRASVARRLGLVVAAATTKRIKMVRKNVRMDNRAPPREEATLNVIEAAVSQWQQPLTEAHIFSWHAVLFPTGRSGLKRISVGAYRTHLEPMQIVTPRVGQSDIVHYEAPASSDVPMEMRLLIDWFNQSEGHIDGFSRAAIAHLWIEAIHPFEDGNGRIGRALSDLALAQDAKSPHHLFSLSHQLLAKRTDYYDKLQVATGKGSLNATAWVQWFIGRIEDACNHSMQQIETTLNKTRYWVRLTDMHPAMTTQQRKVLAKLIDAQPNDFEGGLSTEKYVAITGLSRATAYREISQLFECGLLTKTGQGKATRYQLVVDGWR